MEFDQELPRNVAVVRHRYQMQDLLLSLLLDRTLLTPVPVPVPVPVPDGQVVQLVNSSGRGVPANPKIGRSNSMPVMPTVSSTSSFFLSFDV